MSSKHASLSSHMNPSHPTPPPKDSAAASLNSSLSGSVTAQSLANKSRKGPINKKGGKSLKVACYADDAKEPELIGECNVPIDEVLKQGEVDGESCSVCLISIGSNQADPALRVVRVQLQGQVQRRGLPGVDLLLECESRDWPSLAHTMI